MDRFMYKEFEKNISLFFSFPKKNKHITFNGKYFHGSSLLDENLDFTNENRTILLINLWSKKPINVEYYNYEMNCKSYNNNIVNVESENLEENKNYSVFGLDKDLINYEFMEKMFYNDNNIFFLKNLKNIINYDNEKNISNYKIFLDETIEINKLNNRLKIKYGNVLEDIKKMDDDNEIKSYNRFLQRFIYPKIYCTNVCNWIIKECEKYAKENNGWTKTRHKNYPTTDLPVENVKSISGFIFNSLELINNKIKTSYGLHNEMTLDFSDLFIVKYEDGEQNFLEIHKDGSFLSFNILLSHSSDFDGGGTYFDDGLIIKSDQGDLVIHSSRVNHSGLPITRGIRYLFVGFVNINIPQ